MSLLDAWTAKTNPEENQWYSICWSDALGIFCAVSRDGATRIMTSPSGEVWTARNHTVDNDYHAICWSPELSLFCCVGYGVQVITSPDGINWTERTGIPSQTWHGICWSPELGLFCAVSSAQSSSNVMTSTDGINWINQTTSNSRAKYSICWSPELGLFCAVGGGTGSESTDFIKSSDGILWTNVSTLSLLTNYRSICWSPELGLFCAVDFDGNGPNPVIVSKDGNNWVMVKIGIENTANGYWIGVCWSPELVEFCAVRYGGDNTKRIMTSPDGFEWTLRETPSIANQWLSVCWSPALNIFCAVSIDGTNDRIMTQSFKTITSTITNLTAATDFIVEAFSLSTRKLLGRNNSQAGSVEIPMKYDEPCSLLFEAEQGAQWEASTDYIIGDLCFAADTASLPYCMKVTTAGTSGVTEPVFSAVVGNDVNDNGVVWETVWRLVQPISQSPRIGI